VLATSLGLLLLAGLPATDRARRGGLVLWAGAACLAFASATVVNGLNAGASVLCSDDAADAPTAAPDELIKGRTMGAFRSAGQLGRALGPLFGASSPPPPFLASSGSTPSLLIRRPARGLAADGRVRPLSFPPRTHDAACTSYWLLGPTVCYATNGLALAGLGWRMTALVRREREQLLQRAPTPPSIGAGPARKRA